MRIYVNVNGVILDSQHFRNSVIEKIRSSYDDGDSIYEQELLNYIDWYKEYSNRKILIRDSIRILKGCREVVAVTRALCQKELDATNRVLEELGYPNGCFSIMIKKPWEELTNYSIPEAHFSDQLLISSNVLVDNEVPELSDWRRKGGRAIFFDRSETGYDFDGKYGNDFEHTSKLSLVPKMVGIYKSKK